MKLTEQLECKKINKGFTVVEILIAAGVLSVFLAGLFTLFSGGNRISNQTIWVQNTVNRLKLAAREISETIKKGTYPSSIIFPGNIVERETDDFYINFHNGTLFASETIELPAGNEPATKFLVVTESSPAKTGFAAGANVDATINYHIFSLAKNGHLLYHRFSESVPGDDIATLDRPAIPPAGADLINSSTLVQDVESILSVARREGSDTSPISITINARYPRGNTLRSETAAGTPNVKIHPRETIGGW